MFYSHNISKTIFKPRYSYFKYQVIFFRLFNILITFQKYINKILTKKLDIFIIIFFNNILIYTKNFTKAHVKSIYFVLD